jgi:hypothetical protein
MSAALIGAIVGFVLGVLASISVFRTDRRKYREGIRSRAEYRLSLVVTPLLLAAVGALIAGALAAIF